MRRADRRDARRRVRRVPEADDPAWGRRCRATQQIGYLHKQCSALHVKDYRKICLNRDFDEKDV